ncbi:MAG TPA: hypothetical protein VLJ37_05850 [bacterium]|nr:hypothetical protein [bacterium]
MSCPEISAGKLGNVKSLEDAYRALAILRPKNGAGEQPPRLVLPEGYDAKEFNYLVGTDSQTFNIAPLYANGSEKLNCLLKALGYNADRARKIDEEAGATKDDQAYEQYMANLTPQDALTYNLYRTLDVVDYFRKDAVPGKEEAGGNTDGNPDQISTKELDTWAWAASKKDEKEFFKQGGDVVARLHALLGIAAYLDAHPTEPDAGVSDSGPKVVLSTVPSNSAAAACPSAPASEKKEEPKNPPSPGGILSLVLGAAALASIVTYAVMKNRGQKTPLDPTPDAGGSKKPASKPRVVDDTTEAPKTAAEKTAPRVVSDTTGEAKAPAAGAKTVAVADDIASALSEIDRNVSPAGGARPSGAPLSGGVTPENVIIHGDKGEAVSGVDPAVIRSQIVLTYRHFLSQAAREALVSGKPLPADAELVHSAYTERLNEMVDAVTSAYHKMGPDDLAEMWKMQREDRGYITRRGVPQRLLMSACGEFIDADAARAHSPFAGGMGAEIRTEAERRAGETDFFEKGMREFLKDPARLGR